MSNRENTDVIFYDKQIQVNYAIAIVVVKLFYFLILFIVLGN